MPDDFTGSLAVTFFAAILVLFIASFGRVNPLVSSYLLLLHQLSSYQFYLPSSMLSPP
jgi:hypothetical protein